MCIEEKETTFRLKRYLLGLAGCVLVSAIALALGALIMLGSRSARFAELQRYLERLLGG